LPGPNREGIIDLICPLLISENRQVKTCTNSEFVMEKEKIEGSQWNDLRSNFNKDLPITEKNGPYISIPGQSQEVHLVGR